VTQGRKRKIIQRSITDLDFRVLNCFKREAENRECFDCDAKLQQFIVYACVQVQMEDLTDL
jgi:hypothetical protein